ncbi:MAG: FAD-dependent oxidoreductase [Thermoplasmata archaeon]
MSALDISQEPAESVLVVGGGVAGITAALNLADAGARVYLVDDAPSIGGLMARLDKTFPTNDCSICIEAPMMYSVARHPNIALLTGTEIRRVEGAAPRFRVRLVQRPRFVDAEKCKGCGKCAEACPVSVPDELDGPIGGKRKLISIPFPQAVPNVYVVDDRCRYCKMFDRGACIGACKVDCSQCRECQIARCVVACRKEGAEAVLLWQRERVLDIEVRSIVLAVGAEPFTPSEPHFGLGLHPDVLTNLQFERLLNAGGPTAGRLVRPSDGSKVRSVVWIQCAGRGRRGGLGYCSRVCCMIAVKQSILAREHELGLEAAVLYGELQPYGKGFHEFHARAKRAGVEFIKGRPGRVSRDPFSGRLRVRFEDMESGRLGELEADIVVLSAGLSPPPRVKKLAKQLRIELDERGFVKERDPLGAPLETSVEGVYVCGTATGPADISETVARASAAALLALGGGRGRSSFSGAAQGVESGTSGFGGVPRTVERGACP